MKSSGGGDADNVVFGSSLSNDRHADAGFDYMVGKAPCRGKGLERDEDAVRDEHDRGAAGRSVAGPPRISDGQLLFLLNMLAHARERAEGGSRIAIIMNGSPLFSGDAGRGAQEPQAAGAARPDPAPSTAPRSGRCCAGAWAPSAATSRSSASRTSCGCSPTSRPARPAGSTGTARSARSSSGACPQKRGSCDSR